MRPARRAALLAVAVLLLVAARGEDLFDDELVEDEAPAEQQPPPQQQPRPAAQVQAKVAEYDEEFDKGPKPGVEKPAAEKPAAQKKGAAEKPKEAKRKAEPARATQPRPAPAKPQRPGFGMAEWAAIALFGLFGLNYMWGRRANETIAKKWGLVSYEVLETQFASVGAEGAITTQDSPDSFTIDATGRERCDWLQAKLQLSPRQDLFSVLRGLLTPKPDTLVLDFGMSEEDGDAFVLAVLDKRLDKAHVQELHDLKTLTSPCPAGHASLPASLRAVCESRELATELLGGELGAALQADGHLLEQLHYTDFVPPAWGLPTETKRALHLVFRLPGGGAAATAEAAKPLLRLALLLLDRIGRLRVPPQVREKIKKGRATAEALKFKEGHKQREQLAQQRKAEKVMAARNKEPSANREVQRKREEKEARQAAKKKGPQAKMRRM